MLTLVGWGLLIKGLIRFCAPSQALSLMARVSLERSWSSRWPAPTSWPSPVVAAYGVDRLDGRGELRQARRPVAAGEHELRVRERRVRGIDPLGMELAKSSNADRAPDADVAQQILGLVA